MQLKDLKPYDIIALEGHPNSLFLVREIRGDDAYGYDITVSATARGSLVQVAKMKYSERLKFYKRAKKILPLVEKRVISLVFDGK